MKRKVRQFNLLNKLRNTVHPPDHANIRHLFSQHRNKKINKNLPSKKSLFATHTHLFAELLRISLTLRVVNVLVHPVWVAHLVRPQKHVLYLQGDLLRKLTLDASLVQLPLVCSHQIAFHEYTAAVVLLDVLHIHSVRRNISSLRILPGNHLRVSRADKRLLFYADS